MIIKRRNFIQITTLSLATAMTGFTPSPFSKKAVDTIDTKALTVNMSAEDGNYAFLVMDKDKLSGFKPYRQHERP